MIAALVIAFVLGSSPAPADVAPTEVTAPVPTLEVGEVVRAALRGHPLLRAADEDVNAARASRLSARGAFDPRLRVRANGTPMGGYRYGSVETELRARTLAAGMVAFGGWRLGGGNIPVYDGKLATLNGGEVRAGIEMPLLRDAAIDAPRAERRKADVALDVATLERDSKGLALALDAATAYWDWVAAVGRLEVRRRQLDLAQDRDRGMAKQIAAGGIAPVEGVDNKRVIANREALVAGAERDAKVAALALSLFLREGDRPSEPADAAAPRIRGRAALDADVDEEAEIRAALDRRPDARILAAQQRIAEIDVRLRRNGRLPSMSALGYAAKDIGDGPAVLRPVEIGVGVLFEIPIGLRTARGDYAEARAVARRIAAERSFLAERIAVEIKSAHAEMIAAKRTADAVVEQAALAETVAEAERDRLALGDSNVLLVNLREEAAADAAAAVVDALSDFGRATARFRVSTGRLPGP